jgi:hypothetical protein
MTQNQLVPGRHVTILGSSEARGIVLRVDDAGERARVLDASTDMPSWFPTDTLRGRRGRPAHVHSSGLCRWDLEQLVASDSQFCQEATRFLFGRQTDDEQGSATTRHDNDLGFRADHARKGTILATLAPDAWGDREYGIARSILSRYTGTQLFDLAAEWISEGE